MTYRKIVHLLFACLAVITCCLTLAITTPRAHAQAVNTVVRVSSHAQQKATPKINRTDCNGRTDFLRIWSGSFLDCFANTGFVNVNILYVYKICSGNNSGTIYYGFQTGGVQYFTDFSPGMCWAVPIFPGASNSVLTIYIG